MSFRFGESQDWVGWFRLRYTSTLFHPLGSHARGLLSTAEEFLLDQKSSIKDQKFALFRNQFFYVSTDGGVA